MENSTYLITKISSFNVGAIKLCIVSGMQRIIAQCGICSALDLKDVLS